MNIYRISQTVVDSYDTFDSAIVIAPDADTASRIMPVHSGLKAGWGQACQMIDPKDKYSGWATDAADVAVELIGVSSARMNRIGCVCSSFNAG